MPSFWMLANGERTAGVSIFFVNEDIDAGELCGQEIFEIRAGETLDDFVWRSKVIGANLLLDVLRQIEDGTVRRTTLDMGAGSYYLWPTKEAVCRFRAAGQKLW